jgi:hypothetical protein
MILSIADTHRNQRSLREFRARLQARFLVDTRAVMWDPRGGHLPGARGIVIC